MKKILLLLIIFPTVLFAQKGMQFEHNLSWKEIKAKAKAENKFIFLDAYTTWCGPCRYMTASIFPQEKVGIFFNEKFINTKFQLDTTAADSEEVKKMYQDGHDIMVDYKVNAFPTYLFFSPEGKLVHRAVGSSEADAFIAKAADALNPDKQYFTLLDKYNAGKKDAGFLKDLSLAAMEAYDVKTAQAVSNKFYETGENFLTEDNIKFINKITTATSEKGFELMLANEDLFDKVNGKGTTHKRIVGMASQDLNPKLYGKNALAPNWEAINKDLSNIYPKQAAEILSTVKVTFYQRKKDWPNFQSNIVEYMNKYGNDLHPGQLNDYAWTVFENCPDMKCVAEALEWSKRSFADNNDPMFFDTYANILYKMGKVKEAIEWESKALANVPDGEKADYQLTIDKMKKGIKTWK